MERVAGVDGCKGGWVGAVWDGSGVEWRALPLPFGTMLAVLEDCAVVAVDVPIGLAETGLRPCDVAAREVLGPARGSVFMVPVRAVVEMPEYADACALGRRREKWAPSRQLWAIRDRILDASAGWPAHVVEAHPEVSFREMTHQELPPKRSAPGLAQRMAALGETFGDVATLLARAPRAAAADDALDALACAWTARRILDGHATMYGEPPLVIRA